VRLGQVNEWDEASSVFSKWFIRIRQKVWAKIQFSLNHFYILRSNEVLLSRRIVMVTDYKNLRPFLVIIERAYFPQANI